MVGATSLRFKLRDFLIFSVLAGFSVGMIARAAHGTDPRATIYVTVIVAVCSLGAALGLLVHQVFAVTSLLLWLALVSYVTTTFTSGTVYVNSKVRIRVVDSHGTPIEGVAVTATNQLNHSAESKTFNPTDIICPRTDGDGRTFFRSDGQSYFIGGQKFYLFWCIPIGYVDTGPLCWMTHNGYRPKTFLLVELFNQPTEKMEDSLAVYDKTVVLQSD
jgi:hypothetical protein